MEKEKVLNDLQRIAHAMLLLKEELDRLYEDIKNGLKETKDGI